MLWKWWKRVDAVAPGRGPSVGGKQALDRGGVGWDGGAVDEEREAGVGDSAVVVEGEGEGLGHGGVSSLEGRGRAAVCGSDGRDYASLRPAMTQTGRFAPACHGS